MTQEQQQHVIAMEECAELSHRISKMLRFGPDEIEAERLKNEGRPVVDPEQELTNADRVVYEFNDLIAAMEVLLGVPYADMINRYQIERKKEKMTKFVNYSQSKGLVNG